MQILTLKRPIAVEFSIGERKVCREVRHLKLAIAPVPLALDESKLTVADVAIPRDKGSAVLDWYEIVDPLTIFINPSLIESLQELGR